MKLFLLISVAIVNVFCLKPLTPGNIDKLLSNSRTSMILARVSNCTKCMEVEQAITYVISKSTGTMNGFEMNTETYKKFIKRYMDVWRIAGRKPTEEVPLILVNKYGKISLYQGPKTMDGMIQFFSREGKIIKILTTEQKRNFLSSIDLTKVIGYFPDEESISKSFKKIAHIYGNEINFGIIFKKKIAKTLGLKKVGDILIKNPFEKKAIFKRSSKKNKNMIEFVEKNLKANLYAISGTNVIKILRSYVNIVIGFVESYESAESSRFLKALHDVSKNYYNDQDTTIFVYTLGIPLEEYLKSIGITRISYPELIIISPLTSKKYLFNKDRFSVYEKNDIREWVESYFTGELTNLFRSEEEPLDNDIRDLKVITGKNFDEKVLQKGRSAIILIGKEDCPVCVRLKPTWEEIAKDFSGDSSVLIGSVDVVKNTVDINVEHVPMIVFFPNCDEDDIENKNYIEYQGEKDFKEITNFIRSNKC